MRKSISAFKNACAMLVVAAAIAITWSSLTRAATPGVISYQGRVSSGGTPFAGSGGFKFALVDTAGTTTFWSNDGTSTTGSEPTAAISLNVTNGLYSVLLGDTSIANMSSEIPASVFSNADVRLRVWFNDGAAGSKLLTPDQRIVSVGYAQVARVVDDGSIITAKIADGAVTASKIASFSKAAVFGSEAQTIPSGQDVAIKFNGELYDTNDCHNAVNDSRLTAPEAGVYLITGNLRIDSGGNALQTAELIVRVNGGASNIAARNQARNVNVSTIVQNVSTQMFLNQGDYVELISSHNAGQNASAADGSTISSNRAFALAKLP